MLQFTPTSDWDSNRGLLNLQSGALPTRPSDCHTWLIKFTIKIFRDLYFTCVKYILLKMNSLLEMIGNWGKKTPNQIILVIFVVIFITRCIDKVIRLWRLRESSSHNIHCIYTAEDCNASKEKLHNLHCFYSS